MGVCHRRRHGLGPGRLRFGTRDRRDVGDRTDRRGHRHASDLATVDRHDRSTRWSERFGSDAIDRLRRALASASEPGDSALPRFVPIIAPTNGFFTVLPDDVHPDDEAPDLPTSLSRALLSYTAEFERESEASLPVFANTLRVLADEGIRQRDLPAAVGISKEAVAMMVSHLVREGLATAAPSTKVVELTQRGQAVHESCRARRDATAVGTDTGLRDALVAVLSRREQLAAGLQPPETGWRLQKPYLTQTNAILADPIAALPHHPMVLHRGGWPDGA